MYIKLSGAVVHMLRYDPNDVILVLGHDAQQWQVVSTTSGPFLGQVNLKLSTWWSV